MRRLLALTMLQRGLSIGVYTAASMIIARLLTPHEVGIFSLAAAFLSICSVVREFGITEFLVQDKSLDTGRIRAAYGVAIVVAWSLGLGILIFRHPIAAFYDQPGVAQVLGVMCLTFVMLPFATPTTALLYRDMGVAKVLWIQTIALTLGHATSVTLAWRGFGYMALAWGGVANSACMVSILLWTRRDALRYLPSLAGSRPIWAYCSRYTLSGAFEQASANVHEFVIGHRFGFTSLGLYSRANGLFVQLRQNVAYGISRVLLPTFAQHAREHTGELLGRYSATLRLYTSVVWPMYGLVAALAPEIIQVMYGSQWSAAGPLLRLLCIGATVQAGYAFAGDLLGAMGRAGNRLRITSLTAPLWVVLCVVASTISLQAIALATSVQAAVVLALYLRQLRPLVGVTAGHWLSVVMPSGILVAMVTASAWLVRATLSARGAGVLTLVAATGLAAVVTWMAVAFAIRHPVAGEVRNVIGLVRARFGRGDGT